MTTITELLAEFEAAQPAVSRWAEYPDRVLDDDDLPDCDVMSKRFTAFATERGFAARTVECHPPTPEPWYDGHWFTVIGNQAIDWTARKFYNVADDRDDWIDPQSIPIPMLFEWPGTFPITGMQLTEAGGK